MFGQGWRCCHQSLWGRLWHVYMFKGSLGVKLPTIRTDEKQRREEKKRGRERVRKKQIQTGAQIFRKVVKHLFYQWFAVGVEQREKGCQMQSLDLVPISFWSRSASRSDSFFSYIFHAVTNELCTEWFAVGGVRVGINFLRVLHSVRMVLSRFGDVSGNAEWAVHSVICCWWHERWIVFSWCSTQCAHGFVKIWWCQWMCWMSRAQCDLLLVVWVLAMAWDSVFLRARSTGVSFG